jgi:MYXO-CTERM domain-containing protein
MSKFLATILLVGSLIAAAAATPAGAHWMADTGIFAWDTGSDASDTGGASHDTGTEGGDTGDTGDTDNGNNTEPNDSDTGDTGDTGNTDPNEESTPVYSAAELANDKGGCSTTGGSQGPWVWALFGLLLSRQRRRFA